jgi:hypothetical protein
MPAPPKEWYHKQGIPVGFGAYTGEDGQPIPTPDEIEQDANETQREEDIATNMALNDNSRYVQQMAPGDKARIVQYMHTVTPRQQTDDGRITGEINPELFFAFEGWLAHNSSLGILNDQEINTKRVELDIQEMEVMFAMKRNHYNPDMNAAIRNAKHLAEVKLTQNRDGKGLYLASAEVSEDLRAYRVLKQKKDSMLSRVNNSLRGRE